MITDNRCDLKIITRSGIDGVSGKSTVMALGTFDGVHIAHQSLLRRTLDLMRKSGAELCGAWCFSESPASFLHGVDVPLICTLEERIDIMLGMGLDFVAIGNFADFCNVSAEDFIEKVLKQRLSCIGTVCGFNHRFGHGGMGNHALLQKAFGEDMAISHPEVTLGGETVSSTAIRRHLAAGEIEKANLMLGRNFTLNAKVMGGKKLGRKIGFPTVNQVFPLGVVELKHGIYATVCQTEDGTRHIGAANVGIRPTITDGSDSHALNCETYIIDFDGDLYGTTLSIEFCAYLRAERKFNSVSELSEAIENDKNNAIEYFKNKKAPI